MSSFHTLRELLLKKDEEDIWGKIKKCFKKWDHQDDIEVALEYAKEHMKDWDPKKLEETKLPSIKKLPVYWPLVKRLETYIETAKLPKKFLDLPLENLESLEFTDAGELKSLKGMPRLPSLKEFSCLFCGELKDISDLTNFPNLETLELVSCDELKKFSPISSLKHLKKLDLDAYEVKSLKFLEELPNIENLKFENCYSLKDISGLNKLKNLKELVMELPIALENLAVFSGLTKLEKLDLDGVENKFEDLSALKDSKNLQYLSLSNTSLKSFAGLEPLQKLDEVNMYRNEGLVDISALKNKKTITSISLFDCKNLENLSALVGLDNLESLCINDCEQIDLEPSSSSLYGRDNVRAFQEKLAKIYNDKGQLKNGKPPKAPLESIDDWKKLSREKQDKVFDYPERFKQIEHETVEVDSVGDIKNKKQKALIKKAGLAKKLKGSERIDFEFFWLPSGDLAGMKIDADMGPADDGEEDDWSDGMRVIEWYTINYDGSELYYDSSWE